MTRDFHRVMQDTADADGLRIEASIDEEMPRGADHSA